MTILQKTFLVGGIVAAIAVDIALYVGAKVINSARKA